MSDAGDRAGTVLCSNCKKDILQANFVIHELHCQRFIYLCSKCNEPVNHKEKEAHDNANHVLVQCKNCHVQLEKFLLGEHLSDNCPNRQVKCQICDIEVSINDISEHENYCGARTEKCLECGEYVMFKYKQLHIDSNHAFVKLSDEPGPSASWQNGRRTLGNFLPDFQAFARKSQMNQKKKSVKNEGRFQRSRGSLEYIEGDDETANESSAGVTADGNTFPGKSNPTTPDSEESKGSSDCATDYRPEKRTLKKSSSNVAAKQSTDSTRTVNSDFSRIPKDIKSRAKKGKGNPSRADGTESETVQKETSNNYRRNKFSNDVDDDAAIARAMEENTSALSEFSLFDPFERNRTLPGQRLPDSSYKGKLGKTMRRPQLYEPDDSSDDEFLLYAQNQEDDSDCDGLPCQFCGSLYSPYTLMSHQQICDLNEDLDSYLRKKYNRKRFDQEEKEGLVTCVICSQLVPFSRYGTHQILHDMAAKN